jgi:glycosyltransferase involved in cell wall biosynthesis
MPLPLVTAAITAYNARATILRALESAITQDWTDIEILVVDDGSNDGTPELVEGFAAANPSVARPTRLVRQPNGGVARARNRLIQEARGAFIAFFDDDDVSQPSRISNQYTRILACEAATGSDVVVCHTARLKLLPDGGKRYEPTLGTTEPVPGRWVAERILVGRVRRGVIGSCATCSQMARTSVYRRLGGFDESLIRLSDKEFNIRLGLHDGFFVGIAEPLVIQTITPGAEKSVSKAVEASRYIVGKHADYLRQIGWYEFCMQWENLRQAYLERKAGHLLALATRMGIRFPGKFAAKLFWVQPARASRRAYRQNLHLDDGSM